MTRLPEAGIGEEDEAGAGRLGFWVKARAKVSGKMSYALADQVTYSFGNMVVAALFSRHAGAREFGMYILTQRSLDVLIQFCNVFSWGPYTFNLPGVKKERRRLYDGSMVAQQMVGCVLSALLLWLATRWASTPARGIYYGVFAPLILTSVGILFREFTRRLYFARMRFREAFWTDVATVGLQVAGVGWLAAIHRLNVITGLQVLSTAALLVSFWWLWEEWNRIELRWKANWEDLKLNLQLGRWLFGGNMVFMISSQCNPWVLSAMLGGASVGAYAVCESVVNIPRVALTSMQNVMAPTLARSLADEGKAGLRRRVKEMDRLLLLGSVVFAAGIAVFGPWVAKADLQGDSAASEDAADRAGAELCGVRGDVVTELWADGAGTGELCVLFLRGRADRAGGCVCVAGAVVPASRSRDGDAAGKRGGADDAAVLLWAGDEASMSARLGAWTDAAAAWTAEDAAKARLRRIKIVCAVMLSVCFWFSVPYQTITQGPEDMSTVSSVSASTGEGALGRQIALPIIAAIGLYMLWRLPRRGQMGGSLRHVVMLFAGWAALSVMWSDSPATSAKRLVVFAMDAFFAYTVCRVFSVMEMALWGFVTTGAVALISLYVDAGMQRIFAPFDPDYRFAGVMQPNYQAMNLVVCILCGLTLLM